MTLARDEKRFLAWLVVAVVLITSAPYIFGWIAAPANRTYTGIHRLTPGDIPVYYSFIEQGRQGQVVSRNLYSSEAQPVAAVLTPQWFVVGQFANLFHLPTVLAYQLTRVGFAVLFLLLAYRFLAGMITRVSARKITMVVATFATGFGAFVPIRDMAAAVQNLAIPIDLWVPESFPFLSLYHNPLFLMGLCGILSILLLVERAIDHQDTTAAWVASGLALILAIIHPYDVFLLAAIFVAYFLLRITADHTWSPTSGWMYVRTGFVVLFPAVLALGVLRLTFQLQPGLTGWAQQNVTLSPAVWWYLPAYLIPVLVASLGVRSVLRLRTTRAYMLLAWAAVVPLLLYLPYFPYQRRMMEGWFIALVGLGTLGIVNLWPKLRQRLSPIAQSGLVSVAVTLGILLLGVTSLTHLAKDAYYASFGSEPVSIPSGLADAFTWIRDHTPADAVILTRPSDGNRLPGWTGRTVFYGHDDLTAESERKAKEVDAFFKPGTFDAKGFLTRESINYVLVRTTDIQANRALVLQDLGLVRVFENPDAVVYRVQS